MIKYLTALLIIGPVCSNVDEDCIDESEISYDTYCLEIYDPVCGCNNVTYSNDCYATANGISNWSEGECLN